VWLARFSAVYYMWLAVARQQGFGVRDERGAFQLRETDKARQQLLHHNSFRQTEDTTTEPESG
jgi:hypothetical protein